MLLAQTLAHVACVAILSEHPPTKGLLRERLTVSVEVAFTLLRRCAHTHGVHMSAVARHLVSVGEGYEAILDAMLQMVSTPR